ncbi:MAG: SDR family NAD(P)-dependent oxidoreductase [Candidatus Hodarchaeales archaeon]
MDLRCKKILDLLSLYEKVAVITGAASGIGLATAKLLSEMGVITVLLDIDELHGNEAAAEIRKSGGVVEFFQCDVSSSDECKQVVKKIYQKFRRIDILFNNAGVIKRKSIFDLEERDWNHVIDVNMKSIYLLSKNVIPLMIQADGGSIINTGSGWGLKGGSKALAYCASKGGVVNMTRAMAIDHGKHGIRVNCVCPGDTDTPMLRGEAHKLGVNEEEFLKEAADRPINRVGTAEDIANAVLFLASDLSSWISGTTIIVDGGGNA